MPQTFTKSTELKAKLFWVFGLVLLPETGRHRSNFFCITYYSLVHTYHNYDFQRVVQSVSALSGFFHLRQIAAWSDMRTDGQTAISCATFATKCVAAVV